MDERQQVKKYFKQFPKWAIGAVVIGLLVLVFSGGSLGGIAIGIVLLGAGGLVLWDALAKKPSDAQMDAWLDEDIEVLKKKALSKTGTDPSELVGDAVTVRGPRFWDVANAHVGFKKGKDNVWRFTPVEVAVLNFTQNQVICYKCAFDRETGNALNETTDEYFYKDVVSVSTKTTSKNVQVKDKALQLSSMETFVLTTSGGTDFSVDLTDPKLIAFMGGGGEIPKTLADRAIQTVRKMLREKKATPV